MIVSTPQFSFIQFGDCQRCDGSMLEVKQASDIAFQVLVSEAKSHEVDYVMATDTEVEIYREKLAPLGSLDGQYLYFINPSASLYDLLTEGRCFKFGIANVGEFPTIFSNPIKYSPAVEYSVLLEYRCDEELALGFCYPNGVFNRVRLPLRIYKPQTKEERNIYTMRNGKQKVLSASLSKEFEMETDWISEDFHDKLSIALMHDVTIFDGKTFTKSSNYEISWDDEVLDAATAKCKLIENIIYRNINCGGIKMADSVDLVALVNAVKSLIPIGTVVSWQGDVSKVPDGWEICDGQYSTTLGRNRPDLRGRFVIGYGSFVEKDVTYVYDETNNKGGEVMHTLTVDEMPEHSHNLKAYNVSVKHDGWNDNFIRNNDDSNTNTLLRSVTAGGSKPHNNMPPYFALAYIIRVSQPSI